MSAYHGYPLDEFTGTKLVEYQKLLSTDARRLGLIGFSNSQLPTEILRSLLFADIIPEGARVIDVGSGAGLPGIPLGILRGGVDLVEPHVRAVGFLEKVIRTLSLDVRVHLGTAEQVAQGGDCQPADYVVARALAPSSEAARICAVVCKPGGKILLSARSEESQPSLDPRFQWEGTMSIKGPGIVQRVNVITLKSTHRL
ncbi:MAG TPA: RsmG family class I SAM-dependent methyltransferase [Actinomycetota bacterium]|nr:RsmG family class I SAM-dependent methyltransferase [Actinomycetota bacterium]